MVMPVAPFAFYGRLQVVAVVYVVHLMKLHETILCS